MHCTVTISRMYMYIDSVIGHNVHTSYNNFSALQSTRGGHGDYLNSLVIKVIYPPDAKKV